MFRYHFEEVRRILDQKYLQQRRDEMADMGETSMIAYPTPTPGRPQSSQDAPNRARTQSQAQPMARTQTLRNPRQNAAATTNVGSPVHGGAQHVTGVAGVTIRPALAQTEFADGVAPQTHPIRPELQPRQNAAVDANNRAPLAAEQGGRRLRLEFQYQSGWLICRNMETRHGFALHVVSIMVSTLAM